MGKLKLSEIDKSYLKDFLKYDDKKIDKEWVIGASIANIVVFYLAVCFSEYKLILGILFSMVNISILLSLVYFLKKVEQNKKNLYLYYGIYTSLWSISCSVLSYVFLKRGFPQISYWFLGAFLLSDFVVAILSFWIIKKKISCNYYKSSTKVPVLKASFMIFVILAVRELDVNKSIIIGGCLALIALASAGNIYFIMKYYCYCLLEILTNK